MGNYLRQLVVLSSVAAKYRKFWLVAACILASLALSEPALAQLIGVSRTVTPGGNDYPGGINVSTNQVPLDVTLQAGVNVMARNGVVNAVNLNTTFAPGTGGSATLTANDAT